MNYFGCYKLEKNVQTQEKDGKKEMDIVQYSSKINHIIWDYKIISKKIYTVMIILFVKWLFIKREELFIDYCGLVIKDALGSHGVERYCEMEPEFGIQLNLCLHIKW